MDNEACFSPYIHNQLTKDGLHLYDRLQAAAVQVSEVAFSGIDVSTPEDTHQGRERGYRILDLVKTALGQSKITSLDTGHVKDEKRLNAALTRVKYGLIVVADRKLMRVINQEAKSNKSCCFRCRLTILYSESSCLILCAECLSLRIYRSLSQAPREFKASGRRRQYNFESPQKKPIAMIVISSSFQLSSVFKSYHIHKTLVTSIKIPLPV